MKMKRLSICKWLKRKLCYKSFGWVSGSTTTKTKNCYGSIIMVPELYSTEPYGSIHVLQGFHISKYICAVFIYIFENTNLKLKSFTKYNYFLRVSKSYTSETAEINDSTLIRNSITKIRLTKFLF